MTPSARNSATTAMAFSVTSTGVCITAPAKKEFESLRTIIQVWDAEALLDQLFATYPRLPDSTKAALPLKQVWVLDDDTEA